MLSKLLVYKEKFTSSFERIVNEVLKKDEENPELVSVINWLREAVKSNAIGGKQSRGMLVILTVDILRNGNPSDDDVKKAICLGWCMEILQAAMLVADDVMDQSEMRRGKPCWYKQHGLIAINDTFLMKELLFKLIDIYFNDATALEIYKAAHLVAYKTAMGQCMDMLTSAPSGNGQFNFDSFTLENYNSIVKYKTSYYTFYLPVALAMRIVKFDDEEMIKRSKIILLMLGEFFQIQDDFLDCYGEASVIGKVGRDIEDGKCSWLIVQALQRASMEDKKLLQFNYGKDDKDAVSTIKKLYEKFNLKTLYHIYEEESYTNICEIIKSYENDVFLHLHLFLVNKIYKRQK